MVSTGVLSLLVLAALGMVVKAKGVHPAIFAMMDLVISCQWLIGALVGTVVRADYDKTLTLRRLFWPRWCRLVDNPP